LRAGIAQQDMLQRLVVVHADARHLLRRISRMKEGGLGSAGGEVPRGGGTGAEEDLPAELRGFLEPDVVYLDPMFPGAAARKTAERKPLRVLRRLVGDDSDAAELFHWALHVARKRVVVKRPMKAPSLGVGWVERVSERNPPSSIDPDIVFKGKGVRYDVYVVK
jgi:hypothetical protein